METGYRNPIQENETAEECRRFVFFFKSGFLLRKGSTRPQRQQAARLKADFRAAAEEEARLFGFKCQSQPVSVHVHIHNPSAGPRPQIPPVVKAYLDALQGIAYVDDRQVEHLIVRQDALNHPMLAGVASDPEDEEDAKAAVFIEVEPLEDHTKRFDRAYRSTLWRCGPTPWRHLWKAGDERKLVELRWKERREMPGERSELRRLLEEQKLRDGFLADIDRPGPLPAVTQQIHRVLPLPKLHFSLRRRSKAMLVLPLPGQGKGSSGRWAETRDEALANLAATKPGLPFRGFVGLDIAVRGEAMQGKDIDNLAHSLLAPVEEKLCTQRGTVLGYRVYTAAGEPEGVQLRIIDHPRLVELTAILDEIEVDPPLLDRLEDWAANQSRTEGSV